ncbi:hypothetical protein [uncultured Eubacterium sp.]|uniref:hypothetical protein n=1 Tax=uncultured Eubacterium sp. TaxID=165185 RepID=UPI002594BCDF|nr:hypothetical protein [uncultured Eubacterium sp.]
MNISKRKQGILAIICTIAMIVTSITVYNPREVKADTDYSKLTYNYKMQGEAFMKGSENTKSPWRVAIDESQSKGDIVKWMTTGAGNLNFYNEMYMNVTWHGNYPDATLEINGVKVEKGGDGVQIFNSAEIHVNAKAWINNNAYNVVKVTSADGSQYVTFIVATGDKVDTSSEETTVAQKPSAPKGLVATINDLNTNYTIAFASVTGATKYKFYLNGTYIKDITNGGPNGIVTIEELGLEAGKTYQFGVSAVNAKGESDITTIDVTAPGKKEETTIEDGKEILKNVEFSDGSSWDIAVGNLKDVTYMGAGKIKFGVQAYEAGYNYTSQLKQAGITLDSNKWYVATVTVKSSVARKIQLFIQKNGGDWKVENGNTIFEVKANEDTTFTTTFKVGTAANEYLFGLMLGYVDNTKSDAAEITVSNVSLKGYANKPTKNVTIDGNVMGTVAPGDTYTLPTEAKYGYYDTVNKVIYKADSKITVNDDVNLVSITNVSVKMYDGAAIRIDANQKTPGGIRFKASVDVTCGVAEYKNEITNKVQAGTLITTKDILDANKDVEYNVENANNIEKVLNVKNAGWLEESTHSYSASLINIVKANYDRYFVAKAYVEVPYKNAASEYVYSADDSGNNCANSVKRSISDIARAIQENGYDGITGDNTKNLISSFIVTK